MPLSDIVQLRATNKEWKSFVDNDVIWKSLFTQYFYEYANFLIRLNNKIIIYKAN